jgi:galacturan 1,4-alpha-galacturonidase
MITEGGSAPLVINQCYTLNGASGNCSTSSFDIGNVAYQDIGGSISTSSIAKFQCSRSQNGCEGISFDNVELTDLNTGERASGISCSNIISPKGFTCD